MATGTPVIASDLPVVRELGIHEKHFLLVKSGSAKAIKDAVLRLRNEPELATQLAMNARKRIEEYYTWKAAGEALTVAYQELGVTPLPLQNYLSSFPSSFVFFSSRHFVNVSSRFIK